MWKNRITLDYIKHDSARKKIQEKLKERRLTEESIYKIQIGTDSGYVYYEIFCSDSLTTILVFDNGTDI